MSEFNHPVSGSKEYEAGRKLWEAYCSSGRMLAPSFDLKDRFERLRWIETARIFTSGMKTEEA